MQRRAARRVGRGPGEQATQTSRGVLSPYEDVCLLSCTYSSFTIRPCREDQGHTGRLSQSLSGFWMLFLIAPPFLSALSRLGRSDPTPTKEKFLRGRTVGPPATGRGTPRRRSSPRSGAALLALPQSSELAVGFRNTASVYDSELGGQSVVFHTK